MTYTHYRVLSKRPLVVSGHMHTFKEYRRNKTEKQLELLLSHSCPLDKQSTCSLQHLMFSREPAGYICKKEFSSVVNHTRFLQVTATSIHKHSHTFTLSRTRCIFTRKKKARENFKICSASIL